MSEIKWRCLGENQYRCVLHFIVLSYSRNGFSNDFLMYVRDPGGFLVALVRDGKLKVSLHLPPRRIVRSLLTLAALYTPARANMDGDFRRGKKVSAWYRLMVCRAGNEKTG